MACQTCDHTMQWITGLNEAPIFWCPRCGTLKKPSSAYGQWYVPTLPGRVKKLVDNCLVYGTTLIEDLHTSGITESVDNCLVYGTTLVDYLHASGITESVTNEESRG